MKLGLIQRIIGIFLMAFSLTLLPPVAVSLIYDDGALEPFLVTFVGALAAGILMWYPRRNDHRDMRVREGFLVVVLFWVVLSAISSVPFHLARHPHLPFTDAVFEAVSGLTTTGATVIIGLDYLPHSILWYRQQLNWLGGIGVAVIALAILPILGVGGMQLFRAESSGPTKGDKLTPRLRDTVKAFVRVYVILTIMCTFAFWLAGMSAFDAIGHAFATLATGGFSTHDASMAWFQSDVIEAIAIVFMIAGGISFGLHVRVFETLRLGDYWRNPEARVFLLILMVTTLVSMIYLIAYHPGTLAFDQFMNAAFQVTSVMTSCGFTTESFSDWPAFIPIVLMFVAILGGCAGSTSGGLKTIRVIMIYKQGVREIQRLVHPAAVTPVKFAGRVVSDRVMEAIWGFFAAYTLTYVILMLLFMASGLDQVSAFSAVAATINNMGPGLGEVAANFAGVSDFGKWVAVASMLIGRLEIFTALVLLSPDFWRH